MKTLSRITLFLLAAALLLCLGGCGSNPIEEVRAEAAPAATAAPESAAPAMAQPASAAPEVDSAAEVSPGYDAAAFDAAREALLEEFRIVQITEPGEFREEDHPEIPAYSVSSYLIYRFDGVQLFWGCHDFDGNGVPELVMATGDAPEQAEPIGVYAFDGAGLRYLGRDLPLGERCHLGFADGVFTVQGSGGAFDGEVMRYRIAPDGYSTEVLSRFSYHYDEQGALSLTDIVGHTELSDIDEAALFPSFTVPIDYHAVD